MIGIIILIYIIYSLDFEEIKNAFLSIKPIFIAISLLLTIPRLLLRNYVWQIIIKEQKIKLSFLKSMKILLIGYFYGSITPGYIGRMARIIYVKDKTDDPYGKLFVNTFIETIVNTLSLYIMLVIGAFFIIEQIPIIFNAVVIWVIFSAVTLLYLVNKDRGERLFFTLIKYLIPKKSKISINKFVETFYKDFPNLKKLIIPVFIGLSSWIIMFSQYYILVIALEVEIPYEYFIFLFPVANVISFIPITFAGLGTRELSAIFIFSTLFGAPHEKIFVVSLLGFIITDVITGFYGFFLSLTESRDLKKIVKKQ